MIERLLIDGSSDLNINLGKDQIEKFTAYMRLLTEWNQKVNLTAITEPQEIVIKHFLDSMLLVQFIPTTGILCDVGTGAGFPGIPLKLVMPELQVTLIDSLGKRVRFLQLVIEELGLKGIDTHHARAEDIGRQRAFRDRFDVVVARAVSRLSVLAEYCLPLAKVGGCFIAAKGPAVAGEVEEARYAVKLLGGEITAVNYSSLPYKEDQRSFVVINKVRSTPTAYPRKAGTPEKKPLVLGHSTNNS